jgi:hypothetical protein
MVRFLIHLVIAQSVAVGVASVTKDMFSLTFYATCVCLVIWDAIWGVFYLAVSKQKRQLSAFRFLFSAASAWLVPVILIISLIFIPQETLQSFLHFNR